MGNEYSPYKAVHHINNLIRKKPVLCYFLLTHRCNNECGVCINRHFPHFDRRQELDYDMLIDIAIQLKDIGIKAISFSGGEPLYHNRFLEYCEELLKMGFDLGLISNGSFLDYESAKILKYFKWVRFSINAMTESTYKQFHSRKPVSGYWLKFDDNVRYLKTHGAIIGSSFLITNFNYDEIYEFAKWSKSAGFDTARYSYVKTSAGEIERYNIQEVKSLLEKATALSDDKFTVFPLSDRMNIKREKKYSYCYMKDLVLCITANGGVYSCCALQNSDKGFYGSLHKDKLCDIWDSRKEIDVRKCPACWNDKKNEFMEYMLSEPRHVNFL